MIIQNRTLLCPLLLVCAWACGHGLAAQNNCDSLNTAGFTYQHNGAYSYGFSPIDPASGAAVLYSEWIFAGEASQDFSFAAEPEYSFPGTGDYMVCLRATVEDDLLGICLSTTCELVHVPVDPACAEMAAGFSIVVQGISIQFVDQSVSGDPITTMSWDFGDGTGSTESAPSHIYPGPGPYQACLTITSGPCTSTACNWIYLGPADVPCDTLLQAAIGVVQYERTIAVFDQSTTSGMNSSISWDFGDGSTGTGSPVLHTFQDDGEFQICGNIDLWGPLTPDTCQSTVCRYLSTFPATGLGTIEARPALWAFPVPFANEFNVAGVSARVPWQLIDMLGRVRLEGYTHSAGIVTVDGSQLDAGTYLFRLTTAKGPEVLRVVKCAAGLP